MKKFSKSNLRRQSQSFKIPKKKKFTIEFCQCHQMNHYQPCPNIKEKLRKIYRAICLRYADGLLVQKVLSKDNQQLQNTVLGNTVFIHFEFYFLTLVTNQRSFLQTSRHEILRYDSLRLYEESLAKFFNDFVLFSAYLIHFLVKKFESSSFQFTPHF